MPSIIKKVCGSYRLEDHFPRGKSEEVSTDYALCTAAVSQEGDEEVGQGEEQPHLATAPHLMNEQDHWDLGSYLFGSFQG